jgi:hypothetical protein
VSLTDDEASVINLALGIKIVVEATADEMDRYLAALYDATIAEQVRNGEVERAGIVRAMFSAMAKVFGVEAATATAGEAFNLSIVDEPATPRWRRLS